MNRIVKYEHHGYQVAVREDVKGMHREHCLCFQGCKHFNPEDRKVNCDLANQLFRICQANGLVTPVWECPKFETDSQPIAIITEEMPPEPQGNSELAEK